MSQPGIWYSTQLAYYATIKIDGNENYVLPCYENMRKHENCFYNTGEKQDTKLYDTDYNYGRYWKDKWIILKYTHKNSKNIYNIVVYLQ